jgi:UDP-N-acetylmuramoyl-tripeptide--D-alanyl-D-alanine ligase
MPWAYTLEELAGVIRARTFRNGKDPRSITFSRVSTDTRKLQPGDLFFALKGETFDADQFVGQALSQGAAAAVCTSAALDRVQDKSPLLIVPDVLKALQSFAAWHRSKLDMPVFALTGSAGKTTTKDLVAGLLGSKYCVAKTEGNLNNEIGCPLSLLALDKNTEFSVIEMGANHIGEIARLCELAKPTESAITLIAPAHLEGFGSIENVASAKGEIARALPLGGIFYANMDDPYCAQIAAAQPARVIRVGHFGNPAFDRAHTGDVILESSGFDEAGELRLRIRPIGELRLPLGNLAHATNVLLAVAVGLQHGIVEFEGPLRNACAAATRFRRLSVGQITVIDDTYNANPASMAAAFESLVRMPGAGARIAVVGDMLELGASAPALHEQVGECAARLGVAQLFARGEHANSVVKGAKNAGLDMAKSVQDPGEIAQAVVAIAKQGDILLVKGSRGMRMERVIDALKTIYE